MPRLLRRTLIVLLIALALYSLIGFLFLPGIALQVANRQLQHYAGVPARIERLEFNPFSLALTLHDLHLGAVGDAQFTVRRARADLEWDSLWRGALHLGRVALERPAVQIRIAKDGALNLDQWFERPETETAEPRVRQPFPLLIDVLHLSQGRLQFEDRRPDERLVLAYDDLDLTLRHLSTRAEDDAAKADLRARGPDGAKLRWQGDLGLAPLRSSGHLEIDRLALAPFRPYVRQAVPLTLRQGRLSLRGAYRLAFDERLALSLDAVALELSALALDMQDGQPLLRLPALAITGASFDLARRRVEVDRITSRQLEAWAAREADGRMSWQPLLADRPGDEPGPDTSANPWRIVLNEVRLSDQHLHLADRVPAQEVTLDIGPFDLGLTNVDTQAAAPFGVDLQAALGTGGRLQARGALSLPGQGTLEVSARGIDLRIAQPYLTPFLHLDLLSGSLDSELTIELQQFQPLALRVTGDVDIDQLHVRESVRNRDLLRWRRLHLAGLDYRHGDSLGIAAAMLSQPYVRFVINPDRSTNLGGLRVNRPAAGDTEKKTAAEPERDRALAMRIDGIRLEDGSADFADFSLQPHFATTIESFEGEIGRIDNRERAPARVAIRGKIDRYAPVTIDGRLMPFDPLRSLDIEARFQQVEMTALTPYSSKFAGYRVRRGRLDLYLHYRIEEGRLQAENEVIIDQLQLGEQVNSPDAVDLPLRLAVALLKDSQGTISLKLPVQGNLNDPTFDLMPVVWQALRNLMVRAVKSPFRLLGRLVGDVQGDLSEITFAPGSSELDSQARATLDSLAAALKARPVLRLDVEAQSAPAVDGADIARQRLDQALRQAWFRDLQQRNEPAPADSSRLDLTAMPANTGLELLEAMYRRQLDQPPPSAWQQLEARERSERMRSALIEAGAQSPALLRSLSQARAAVIKGYLVDRGGLEDRRIYLLDTGLVTPVKRGQVPTQLYLDTL